VTEDAAEWHDAPPPSIGWWPIRDGFVSWWNGKDFSIGVATWVDAQTAAKYAGRRRSYCGHNTYAYQWTDRPASWPERSRT
jgi:hypothetical protein